MRPSAFNSIGMPGALFFLLGSFAPSTAQTLGEALNAANVTWVTGGYAPWTVETGASADGVASAEFYRIVYQP